MSPRPGYVALVGTVAGAVGTHGGAGRRRLAVVSFAPYVRRHRGAFVALLVLSLASAATALAQPWLVGRIIQDATGHRPLLPVLTVAVLVALVDVLLAGGQQYLLQRTAHGLVLGVRVRFIDRMLRLTVPEYDRRSTGDLVARLGNDTGALHAAVTSGGVEAAAAVLWAIGAAVAMALIDLPLLFLALGTFAVFVTASVVASRGVQDLARTELEEYGRMSAAGLRVLGAVRTVRAYGATEQEAGTVAGHARRTYDAGLRHARRAAVVHPTANAGMQASQILLLTVGGIRVASGDLPVASLVSFLLYVNMFVGPVYQLIRAWSSLQQGLGALDRIAEIEGLPAEEEVAAGSVVDRAASRGPGPSVHVGLRVLGAVRTVRASGATEQEAGTVAGHARRTYDAGLRHARRAAVVYPTAHAGMQASQILLLTVGGIRVASGDLPVASLVSFLLYVNMFVGPVYQLIRAWSSLQQGLGALDRIAEIEGLPAEEEVGAGSVVDPAVSRGPGSRVHVGLRGVSFDYGDGSGLHEVSFDVPRGATVALVGPSGAGKSTVLSLIQRFYEPDAGSVVLDGVDLRCLSHRELRERMTYAEQEPAVLEGTVRSNIALGSPDAPESRVRAALHEVNLATLEHRSPEGLDAAVGERGVRLSGGERQRLTIARALLPGRELLLLDEPTAQLDPANEDQLRQAIRSRQGRTVLVAAHRLSTVLDADRIIVMEAGRVVATGTHDELVRCSPLYRSMARAQRLV